MSLDAVTGVLTYDDGARIDPACGVTGNIGRTDICGRSMHR